MNNTILYNPECSKSRELLTITKSINIKFVIRNYLIHPLSKIEIDRLILMLELETPEDLLRKGSAQKSSKEEQSDKVIDVAEAIANNPELLQRPIVIMKEKAIIARPPSIAVEFIEKLSPTL